MSENEVIYVAKPNRYLEQIYNGYTRFFEEFSAQLRQFHEVRALDLPDIWVRDFLPVQNVQTGALTRLFFDPRYANYTAKFTAEIRQQVRGLFPQAKPSDVRMDGGNIVLTPDKKYALCMEKQTIFHKSDVARKAHVERELTDALGVEQILWIAHQAGDKIGHIDGYIQCLGLNLIEGIEELYGGITTGGLLDRLGAEKLYHYGTTKVYPKKNSEQWTGVFPDCPPRPHWVYLMCRPDEQSWLSARGLYVNFLETSRAVFLAQFDLPEDEDAFYSIKQLTKKPVVRVDCRKIAEYGGVVHCLTREYSQ